MKLNEMNDDTRELDLALAEFEQENRLLRARNERLEDELAIIKKVEQHGHDALTMAIRVLENKVKHMAAIIDTHAMASDPAGLKLRKDRQDVAIPNT